jgi:hypothetical protein
MANSMQKETSFSSGDWESTITKHKKTLTRIAET